MSKKEESSITITSDITITPSDQTTTEAPAGAVFITGSGTMFMTFSKYSPAIDVPTATVKDKGVVVIGESTTPQDGHEDGGESI